MKTITKNTILKQGDKVYQPVEVDVVIYWLQNRPPLDNEYWTYINEFEPVVFTKNVLSPSWYEKLHDKRNYYTVLAQSSPILESIPVISLDSYVQRLAQAQYPIFNTGIMWMGGSDDYNKVNKQEGFINGFKSNPNQYTKDDLVKAIELARTYPKDVAGFANEEILEQISSINEIEVDDNFNVINFK